MKTKIAIVTLLLFSIATLGQEVKVTSGKVVRFANFKSKFVDARNIDVWLPKAYSTTEKYAVLYMHDGQMLFDAESSWNKQAWEVDEVAGKLIIEEKTKNFIVVGIWNNGLKRHPEYFPQKPYITFDATQKKFISESLKQRKKIDTEEFKVISDNYLKFIVKELKPFVDKNFNTYSNQSNTFIAGSSMGGLISLYAICEYPKIFGGAACLSTHWTGIYQNENNPIPDAIMHYLNKHLPKPKNHKIYFDYGNQTLDSLYKPSQEKVNKIMISKGYSDKSWNTIFFPGKDHSEKSWHDRLNIPLEFLLSK
ncbi:alpha/beta hydrolase [Flavobacterium luteum]|uniref:Alpha/beta hydrolase n=1 Tax=Flavobacterium luteum TaxID=2026654 RepID=A0A7J5ABB3_9FLAO|nr:alpha/beta hydrolase-fold protein [Flavobacterium luteum]KAB1154837.1 alpha/beta hydrolase [Flavobacterium luteum]